MIKLLIKLYKKISRLFYANEDIFIMRKINENSIQYANKQYILKLSRKHVECMPKKHSTILLNEINSGNYVYGCIIDGKIAHYSCVYLKKHPVREINKIFNLPKNHKSIYIFNCYTFEGFRRRSLYSNMLKFIVNKYKKEYKYIIVSKKNIISYNTIKKEGFKIVGKFKFKKIFKYKKTINEYLHEDLKDSFEFFE